MLTGYYEIPRDNGFEEVMDTLVTRITQIEHFKHHTGCSFSNDVFELRPYYFGKCLCRYGKSFDEFLNGNPHAESCFHTELKILNDAFKKHPLYIHANKLKAERANEERRLCIAHNINYKDGKNIEDICNCGCMEKFISANNTLTHEDFCPKIIPNFYFKQNNLKIYWYKTYFRDAQSSVQLPIDEFKRIIGICLSSI